MQHLLQLKRAESVLQTTESIEIWECDVVRDSAKRGQRRQDRCHTCVGTAASAEPLPRELTHLEELRAGLTIAEHKRIQPLVML